MQIAIDLKTVYANCNETYKQLMQIAVRQKKTAHTNSNETKKTAHAKGNET